MASEAERFAAFAVAVQEANGWANCCSAVDAAYGGGVSAAAFAVSEAETIENAGGAITIAELCFSDFMQAPTLIAAFEAYGGVGAAAAWAETGQDRETWEYEEHADREYTVVALGKTFAAAAGISSVTSDADPINIQKEAQAAEQKAQCDLIRDIFGHPLRPAAISPYWLPPKVGTVAQDIYSEKAFDRMPLLADALQDAGCDNDDILNHCRSDGPHARGCWVLDLLTGRK
ncbi:hypothetical protein R5W24_003353 [Gemmata sp. JC717]|uniref:hypothetical protein n=1 Tax=Gemmata algarum TaxID=2975278 RepID=UPI0021BB95CE|nr:hypothetical protein [Gemmata algarum]MDY3554234.1 hypothetical protein [Gemmata algarum]